jgi:hypothetical protein
MSISTPRTPDIDYDPSEGVYVMFYPKCYPTSKPVLIPLKQGMYGPPRLSYNHRFPSWDSVLHPPGSIRRVGPTLFIREIRDHVMFETSNFFPILKNEWDLYQRKKQLDESLRTSVCPIISDVNSNKKPRLE